MTHIPILDVLLVFLVLSSCTSGHPSKCGKWSFSDKFNNKAGKNIVILIVYRSVLWLL